MFTVFQGRGNKGDLFIGLGVGEHENLGRRGGIVEKDDWEGGL